MHRKSWRCSARIAGTARCQVLGRLAAKRIEAEIAKTDRALMQRRVAGRNGGIKSGIARAVTQGEAIIRAEAEGKRALRRKRSGPEAVGAAESEQPRTNHNHKFESSSASSGFHPAHPRPWTRPRRRATPDTAPARATRGCRRRRRITHRRFKPANQWSRQELDALFARRGISASAGAAARPPDAPLSNAPAGAAPPNPQTGE